MSAAVVVPFYGDNPYRSRALAQVGFFYAQEFPDWQFILGWGYSIAEARNRGASLVQKEIRDVLVFNDADSLCPPEQIRVAVEAAANAPGLVVAFDSLYRLSRLVTLKVLQLGYRELLAVPPPERETRSRSLSGCVAIRRECFEQVGGYDETYEGYGYEDQDFARRCAALWPTRRVPGRLLHLWHGDRHADDSPADQDPAWQSLNRERFLASA